MKGRKPKPPGLKLMDGTRKDRLPQNPPTPAEGLPSCPAHMDEKAKVIWHRLGELLLTMGAAKVDGLALERLCSIYARIRDCEQVIKNEGLTYESETESGSVMIRPRPEVNILAVADKEFRALLVEFGLTPSSRCRIDLGKLGASKSKGLPARKRHA